MYHRNASPLSDFIVFSPMAGQSHTHRTFTPRSPPCRFYLHKFVPQSLRMAKTRCMRQVLFRRCNVKTCCSKDKHVGYWEARTSRGPSPVPSYTTPDLGPPHAFNSPLPLNGVVTIMSPSSAYAEPYNARMPNTLTLHPQYQHSPTPSTFAFTPCS